VLSLILTDLLRPGERGETGEREEACLYTGLFEWSFFLRGDRADDREDSCWVLPELLPLPGLASYFFQRSEIPLCCSVSITRILEKLPL